MRCSRNEVPLCCIHVRVVAISFAYPRSERRKPYFSELFSACIASGIEISCSFCFILTYRDQPLEKHNFTWSTGPSFSTAACLSEFWTGSPHSQGHDGERKLHVEGRKEGRQAIKQAGRQAGRLLHYRANENETMCLSCLLAFTLLAHDETVLCSTLGTRVVVGTSSRRSSHPRVRFAHVNKNTRAAYVAIC